MEIRDLPQASELTQAERTRVSGGFKSEPNYVSADVIDARGGQFTFLGHIVSFDTNGKVTNIS
jgi:hypothetical protein